MSESEGWKGFRRSGKQVKQKGAEIYLQRWTYLVVAHDLCTTITSYVITLLCCLFYYYLQYIQVQEPDDILKANRLIFPGVGAFATAMNVLNERGLVESKLLFLKRFFVLYFICCYTC